MKLVYFVYPTNRRQTEEEVKKGTSPDNALYGYNYLKSLGYETAFKDVSLFLERVLDIFFLPLHKLFTSQVDFDFKLGRALLQLPAINKADVIVANIDGMASAITFLRRLKIIKPPVIYAVGLFYIKGKLSQSIGNKKVSFFFKFYKWLLFGADHILYHAPIEKEKLKRLGVFNPATCAFIPIGSDNNFFTKARRNETKTHLVLSVGKDRARDYKTLLIAAEKLPDVKFALVCRKANIKNCKLPKNVQLFFDIPYGNVLDLYKEATIIVIPIKEMYRSSGQMTLTDTMQAAKPLIITNVVGIAHYNLQNRENCVLVKPNDPTGLANSIRDLIDNKTLRTKIQKNLHMLAASYNTKNYAKELSKVIEWTTDPVKLAPVKAGNLEFIRNLRNANRHYFVNDGLISKKQQDSWYKSYVKKENDYMFIMKKDGANVGMGAIYDVNFKNKSAEIGRFAIEEKLRNQGLGELLLKKIECLAFERLQLKTIKLEVFKSNTRALKLYKSSGFKVLGKRKVNGHAPVIMVKKWTRARSF